MTRDIVEKLDLAELDFPTGYLRQLVHDAAAEILRLRVENEALRELANAVSVREPDGDGLVWLSISLASGQSGAFNLGREKLLVAKVALEFERMRLAALRATARAEGE